jgi:enoyl-CoA hydratase
MNQRSVLKTVERGVGTLRLNRPEQKNAVSFELTAALAEALEELDRDPQVKVIILAGVGDNFSAGADVTEMLPLTASDVLLGDFSGCCVQLSRVQKPVIAAVEGYALGGGCELVEMCDIVIASETAKFGHPEVTLGTMSGAGGTQRLPRLVGKHRAMDLLLTGRFVSAREALASGLVSRVVPATNLWSEVNAVAERIAGLSAPVVQIIKQAVTEGLNGSLFTGLALERKLFHLTFSLADRAEGMAAFLQKRSPHFKGR